jgi:hypothetical protein
MIRIAERNLDFLITISWPPILIIAFLNHKK